jgi:predicted ATPase/DNA-binding winged helix-turn-helix (wHTH) protein
VQGTSLTREFMVGACLVQPQARQVLDHGKPAKLGARAFDVLLALANHRDRVVTKNELLDLVWPGQIVEENNLQVHISSLRKLLGPQAISTIPGRGYRFTVPIDGAKPTPEPTAPTAMLGIGNLPFSLPALVGRDVDVAALSSAISAHAITTIVGAGGIGKTRLAQATALAMREDFPDGVWLVELAPVSDPALVPAAVAQVLGITLSGKKSPQDEAIAELRTRHTLLILDNCEHVLEAASALAKAVRENAPRVHLLVTSQEVLKLEGEQQYRLAPLVLPVSNGLDAAHASGAVTLFVDRVRALRPSFTLDDQNVADVSNICRQLDGLPLAIELAAARVPLLGVAGVHARLNERFRVLTGGTRDAPRRHQTLRETLDWSHSLLSDGERIVLRRAGVFLGGFSLTVGQMVLTDAQLDEWAVIDHLGALVDKSLVVADASEPPRYRLLESTRAYALDKLRDAGEAEFSNTRTRHAEAIRSVFWDDRARRYTDTRDARLERMLPEIDNLRGALDWSYSLVDRKLYIALAAASAWIWVAAGQRVEGLWRCEQAQAHLDATTPAALEADMHWARANVRVQSGVHEFSAGDVTSMTQAVALYRALDDRLGLYNALCLLSIMLAIQGNVAASERAADEGERLYDKSWPPTARWPMLAARNYFLYNARGVCAGRSRGRGMLTACASACRPSIAWSLARLSRAVLDGAGRLCSSSRARAHTDRNATP